MQIRDCFPPLAAGTDDWHRRWLGNWPYWCCQLGGWGAFLSVWGLLWPVLELGRPPPAPGLAGQAALWVGLILCTHVLRLEILHLRRPDATWLRLSRTLVPGCLAGGVALWAYDRWVRYGLLRLEPSRADPRDTYWGNFGGEMISWALLCGMWMAAYAGTLYYRNYRTGRLESQQLRTAIRQAELNALRAQLNPHFLFNSLNTLRALIPRELAVPREAVTLLAELLRGVLLSGRRPLITLEEDLVLVANYLDLARLGGTSRLQLQHDIGPEALSCPLPPFTV